MATALLLALAHFLHVAQPLALAGVAGGAGFLVATAAGFEAQRFGARGRALGMTIYQSYF